MSPRSQYFQDASGQFALVGVNRGGKGQKQAFREISTGRKNNLVLRLGVNISQTKLSYALQPLITVAPHWFCIILGTNITQNYQVSLNSYVGYPVGSTFTANCRNIKPCCRGFTGRPMCGWDQNVVILTASFLKLLGFFSPQKLFRGMLKPSYHFLSKKKSICLFSALQRVSTMLPQNLSSK